ncbi:MAG: prepilin-type N-terminal cleavage/methylation domain-containing protein [Patescibacteria group bacterium]|nr:prepilin-type N-terminal cleavage/methylation domain-containing protein [Patescibacteria group bacterium]
MVQCKLFMDPDIRRDDKEDGFTLVEVLVAIAIVSVIGVIIVAIFASTLRGSNKAQILAVIKQNGQAVLEGLDKSIRGSDNVVCPSAAGSSDTLVIVKDGCYTRYRFVAPSPSPNPVQNGQIQVDYPQPNPSAPCMMNSPAPSPMDVGSFVSTVCTDPMPSPNSLTDTNTQLGVSVDRLAGSSGLFTRSIQSGSKDGVSISFIMNPGVAVPPSLSGQIDSVIFQTTIQLR